MPVFDKLPGFTRAAPGLEQRIWRRLPAILLWGTLLPLLLAVGNHLLAPAQNLRSGATERALLLWDFTAAGVIAFHWMMVLTVGLGCLIVRIMKGPAYVADGYTLPKPREDEDRV